jgi:hypothetical protein
MRVVRGGLGLLAWHFCNLFYSIFWAGPRRLNLYGPFFWGGGGVGG